MPFLCCGKIGYPENRTLTRNDHLNVQLPHWLPAIASAPSYRFSFQAPPQPPSTTSTFNYHLKLRLPSWFSTIALLRNYHLKPQLPSQFSITISPEVLERRFCLCFFLSGRNLVGGAIIGRRGTPPPDLPRGFRAWSSVRSLFLSPPPCFGLGIGVGV